MGATPPQKPAKPAKPVKVKKAGAPRWPVYVLVVLLALDAAAVLFPIPLLSWFTMTYAFVSGLVVIVGLFLYVSFLSARGSGVVEKSLADQGASLSANIQALTKAFYESSSQSTNRAIALEGAVAKVGETVSDFQGVLSGIEKQALDASRKIVEVNEKVGAVQGAFAGLEKALSAVREEHAKFGGVLEQVEWRSGTTEEGMAGLKKAMTGAESAASETLDKVDSIVGVVSKLQAKLADFDKKASEMSAKLASMEKRSSGLEAKLDQVSKAQDKVSAIEKAVTKLEAGLGKVLKSVEGVSGIEKSLSRIEGRGSRNAAPKAASRAGPGGRASRPRRNSGKPAPEPEEQASEEPEAAAAEPREETP